MTTIPTTRTELGLALMMLMSVLRYVWKVTLPYVAFPALTNSAMMVWMEATLRKMKMKTRVTQKH
jgi:hypothetical protein